jgi:IQ domain-containing protein G
LKDSTKKLCRLFKDNPDIAKDAQKVKLERVELQLILEKLLNKDQTLKEFAIETTRVLEE